MEKSKKIQAQLVIVVGFLILYLIFEKSFLLYISVVIGSVSIVFPKLGEFIADSWFKLAHIMGTINGKILLSVVFFLILSPMALFYRLFTKDTLKMRNTKRDSIFFDRNYKYSAEDFENTW